MTLRPGEVATVGVALATLWSEPGAVRPVDAPALGVPPDVRSWVGGLSVEQRVYEGVLSQLLLGERVLVEELRDGWVRIVALDQPAGKLDAHGYPGWLPASQLVPDSTVDGPLYIVDVPSTALRDAPGGPPALPGVVLGTRLASAGPVKDGWLPVHVPGRAEPLWAAGDDVLAAPGAPGPARDALALARRLLDVAYVWGGLSPAGIDCSGLVHLVWRRLGVTLPRDADDQFAATAPVPLGEERPGDLYFFARTGKPVHHVGFVAAAPIMPGEGDRRVVHACYAARRVVAEPVRGDRLATLVGARRVAGTDSVGTRARPVPAL